MMQNKGSKPNGAAFTPLLCCRTPEKQMEKTFSCILLLLSWSTTVSKYVYINDKRTWHNAQKYCRKYHTDLAHVSNKNDNNRLKEKIDDHSWIGLQRDELYSDKWRWSGGGEVSVFFWAHNQPENRSGEDYGMMLNDNWHDSRPDDNKKFLCYRPIVVRERKTWEDAIGYCRQHHRDLASLLSETEMILINNELLKDQTTEPLWIGLHFFSGKWLWVDGEATEYKAWGQDGEPACPNPKQVCTALRMKPPIKTVDTLLTTTLSREWEAHNCDDRLYFICY